MKEHNKKRGEMLSNQGPSEAETRAAILAAREVLLGQLRSPILIGTHWVKDIRSAGVQRHAIEAADMTGIEFIGHTDPRNPKKVILKGERETVTAFIDGAHREYDINDVYGSPGNGIAFGTQLELLDQIWCEEGSYLIGLIQGEKSLYLKLLDEGDPRRCFWEPLKHAQAKDLMNFLLGATTEVLRFGKVTVSLQNDAATFIHEAGTWTLKSRQFKRFADAFNKALASPDIKI